MIANVWATKRQIGSVSGPIDRGGQRVAGAEASNQPVDVGQCRRQIARIARR